VEQARQTYRIDKANMLPTVSASVMANRETNDYFGEAFKGDPQHDLKASLSWEIDLWGKYRWAKRKGHALWQATVEDERAMRMTLIAEVAKAYFTLMALDNEIAIVRRTLVTRQEGVDKARLRFKGGLTSELVYRQAQVEYATTATMIPNLESRIGMTQNALSLLMGEMPDKLIPRGNLTSVEIMSDENLPVGLPSKLLTRRPDIRSAQQSLRAAMANVGMSHADRFPQLTFNLTGGWENDALSGFFRSPFSFISGNLTGPIFDFGRKKAKYKAAIAAYEQSRLSYEQTVLKAFKEVDDAVLSYRKLRQSTFLKTGARNAARQYLELAEKQYRAGSINYIEVLDAQRRHFDAIIGLSNAIRDENLALVDLYKSLGGGW
ncbi:MAG: TolC family protein, partial [Muribaculaceae bacterium]|nr:TolC family protein [Muribaculaceae bacterium]